jgi:hypothetical protein
VVRTIDELGGTIRMEYDDEFCRVGTANRITTNTTIASENYDSNLVDCRCGMIRSISLFYRSLISFDRNCCNQSIVSPIDSAIIFTRSI